MSALHNISHQLMKPINKTLPELQETNSEGVCPHPEIVSALDHISDTGCHGAIYKDRSQGDVKLAHNTLLAAFCTFIKLLKICILYYLNRCTKQHCQLICLPNCRVEITEQKSSGWICGEC